MKKYVMFCYIGAFGGGQNYVNTKVKYLEENGWKVYVFTPGVDFSHSEVNSPWINLQQFKSFASVAFRYSPEFWSKRKVKDTLKWMIDCIKPSNTDEIILESHTDVWAEWGELLAEKINAKHICFLLDEQLEKYGAKEFLYYKYLRKEVAGIHKASMQKLFSGYKSVPESDEFVLRPRSGGSIADIYVEKIDKLEKKDFNIAYIGRNKQYCDNIVKGVFDFANSHKDKTIQFIILGDIVNLDLLKTSDNIKVVELGFMNPIPKYFFSKLDVAIAGAGCARIAANEGVPTILADAAQCLSSGVLGYTVFDALFSDDNFVPFNIELENVLVKKLYKDIKFNLKQLSGVEESYKGHFRFIEESDNSQNYFNFKKYPQKNYKFIDKPKFYFIKAIDFMHQKRVIKK